MYERECVGCGERFTASNYRKQRCRPNCGRTGGQKVAAAQREYTFVGVDGEGVDRPDGRHEYVMLSVGDRTLFDAGRLLTPGVIFQFLYECFLAGPKHAVYVGFFLGYDFIQWERGLPETVARSLLTAEGIALRKGRRSPTPDPVVWEGWEFDVLAGRRWKLRPHSHRRSQYDMGCRNRTCAYQYAEQQFPDEVRVRDGESLWRVEDAVLGDFVEWEWVPRLPASDARASRPEAWMYVCDTGPFWQSSFLKVINPKAWPDGPVCTEDEYSIVVQGKADRGLVAPYGDISYADEMARYNTLENDILARVTARLDAGFRNEYIPIHIKPADWYGPGRAAQTWMDMLSELTIDSVAKEHNATAKRNPLMGLERRNEYTIRNADVYHDMPEWAQQAAQATYYGGWFEQMVHGHVGTVWEYDINSAYPYVIAQLPCLHTTGSHTGVWTHGVGDTVPSGGFSIIEARVVGSDPYIGSMPHRDSKGRISRPNNVEGWYWRHELEAAMRAGVADGYEVKSWVHLHPCDCPPPFNPPGIGIERMYNLRLQVGKNTPQGKGFKLVYNSAYGKTAQSIGAPKYSNPLYASLITAGCRTQILDAIATHPKKASAVSMVATDGVYFTSPHPSLDLDKTRLGAWDETVKHELTQLMPGVYWDEDTRSRIMSGSDPSLKSRGVNAADLAANVEALDSAFEHMRTRAFFGNDFEWPTLTFSVAFLLDSAKSALARGKWDQAGRVQHSTTRMIDSNPHSKRDITTTYVADGLVRTRPYVQQPLPSLSYDKTFGYTEYQDGLSTGGYVTMDGRDELAWFRDLLSTDGME